ncbi:MAG: ABC transporter ATP-binding protein [Planctomycetota bacterium]
MILKGENIAFAYRRGREVFHGLDVAFAPAAVTAVLGPNGCGKSTLLRLCLGNLTPAQGSVQLDGIDVRKWPRGQFARAVALVPQRDEMAFGFTVAETVGFGLLAWGLSRDRHDALVDAAIQELGLQALATELVTELSQGQRQRVLLARAVAQLSPVPEGSGVLLADEPAAALDPRFAVQTLECLRRQAARRRVVVAVMHDINSALRFADHAVLLDDQGRIAAMGSPGEALTAERLAQVYGVEIGMLGTISAR